MEYLHNNANMLHGDIKPANILIKGDIFKLCDFGTTLVLDENKKCNFDDYTTTEPFMPPEGIWSIFYFNKRVKRVIYRLNWKPILKIRLSN